MNNLKLIESHLQQKPVPKHEEKDVDEHLNPLMWAHYADSHRGICIKYHFHTSLTKLGGEDPNVIHYFKDVKYSDEDLRKYSEIDSISYEDAFFLKGKQWEYENELRFIHFDMNGKNNYDYVTIPNSIEAVYFGIGCSKRDRETIMNILKDRKYVEEKWLRGDNGELIIEEIEHDIEFYQIEENQEHFGTLKANRIKGCHSSLIGTAASLIRQAKREVIREIDSRISNKSRRR